MRREGILFQGLCMEVNTGKNFIEEEGIYYRNKSSFPKVEFHYVDSTYFLLYGIGKNRICRELVQGMESEWRNYLQKKAKKSKYQGEVFWQSFSMEEQECAKAVLGLLEDIRGGERERAELAWIGFWYLVYKGFREIYVFLEGYFETTFQVLTRLAKEKNEEPFACISYLCLEFLFAEELEVKIRRSGLYFDFYLCMQRCIRKWENGSQY